MINMIRNIVFDFGKVLVDYDFDLLMEKLYPPQKRRPVYDFVMEQKRRDSFDLGFKPFEEVVADYAMEYPEIGQELKLFGERKHEVVLGEMPGMKDLLKRLKAGGFKLYGLSNWDTQVYITMEQYDIFDLLDGRIISCEEHAVKPGPEIYRRLFDRYSLAPQECVFVDDKLPNIKGAENVGMRAVLFKDAAQLEKELCYICEVQNF